MSIRNKNGSWIVEIYDPVTKGKRHVKPHEHAMDPPRTERQAKQLERAALNARDERRPGISEETCDSFATRWPDDYPGKGRGESTRRHNRERVGSFGREHTGRPLRSFTRDEAIAWSQKHPATVPALRAMFTDAVNARLADENVFAKLGLEQRKGREDITVLTTGEVDRLAELAEEVHGEAWGPELAAMIRWAAYTCARPGETYAARYSLLDGDVYHLQRQFNSQLGRETAPKHDSAGAIYVPEQALRAVQDKPRRLGDDLIFRTKRGKQFRQESLHRAWSPVRAAFLATLPPGHHLKQRLAIDSDDHFDFYELRHFGATHMLNDLEIEPWVIAKQLRHSDGGRLVVELYGHPSRTKAIELMRRAYAGGGAVRELLTRELEAVGS
jgi:integrase